MLRLLDVFALLASPFAAALDQEFGGRAIDRPRPAPQPEPTPEPQPEPATPIADVPAVADTLQPVARVVLSPVSVDFTAEAGIPAAPLFVAVGEGRGRRYRRDDGSNPGPRFRKVVLPNRRTKFVLAT